MQGFDHVAVYACDKNILIGMVCGAEHPNNVEVGLGDMDHVNWRKAQVNG